MLRSVSIIGAGRVGRVLGKRLREVGWRIGAVVTRSPATSRAAARAIGGGTPQAGLTCQALMADVILLATPDDTLAHVARALARACGDGCRGKVVLHTSGALDRSVLGPLERRGAATGSLHPMQTFSGHGVPKLHGVIFAVEGDPRARRIAKKIARALGGVPVAMGGSRKGAYHAAGAFVAGHTLALTEAATQVLIKLGFTRRHAVQALLPLARQMLENLERLGPQASWTGPIARGDYATVVKHKAALRRYPREFQEAYDALAFLSGRVLSKNPGATLTELKRTLKNSRGGKK